MLDMFAGPDRNKTIMLAVAVVAIAPRGLLKPYVQYYKPLRICSTASFRSRNRLWPVKSPPC